MNIHEYQGKAILKSFGVEYRKALLQIHLKRLLLLLRK
jgi:succinyl-CoA synthetase beta subunit